MRYRRTRRAITMAGLVGVGVLVWNLPMSDRETGNFVLTPLAHTEIRAPVAGFVTDIYYREGEEISEGATIADMEVPELESQIAGKRAEIAEVRAILGSLGRIPNASTGAPRGAATGDYRAADGDDLEEGSSGTVRTLPAKGKVQEIKAELDYARQKFDQARKLNRTKAVSDDRLLELEKDYRVWLHKYEQALSEEDAETARLGRLTEELKFLKGIEEKLALRSPISGVVTTERIGELRGRYYEEGDLIFEVVDPASLEAEVTLGEQNMTSIEAAQKVVLKPFSLPNRTFEARVARIAPVIQQPDVAETLSPSPGGTGKLKVYCTLEQPMPELTPGMSGYARIHLSDTTFGYVVTSRLMRFVRTEFWW